MQRKTWFGMVVNHLLYWLLLPGRTHSLNSSNAKNTYCLNNANVNATECQADNNFNEINQM